MKNAYVYFITNWTHEVLYTGVTNNLERRLPEHESKLLPGFSKKYNLNVLVYYEHFTDMSAAIAREKQLKNWRREKKDALVNRANPTWQNLYVDGQILPFDSITGIAQ